MKGRSLFLSGCERSLAGEGQAETPAKEVGGWRRWEGDRGAGFLWRFCRGRRAGGEPSQCGGVRKKRKSINMGGSLLSSQKHIIVMITTP